MNRSPELLPCFETARISMRPRSVADFEACLAMDRDPNVTGHNPGPWNDPARHEQFLRRQIQKSFDAGLGYWSIFPNGSPRVL